MPLLAVDIMIFVPYITVVTSIVFGIIFLVNGYKKNADGKTDERKISRGYKAVIWGTILALIFAKPILNAFTQQQQLADSMYNEGWSMILILLVFPVMFLLCNGFIAFCFINGIKLSKRKKFNENGEKVLDVETAAYGCVLLVAGTLFLIACIFFIIVTFFPSLLY